MEKKEYITKVLEASSKMRNAFIELNELFEQYEKSWERDDIEAYHVTRDAVRDFVINGARLCDKHMESDNKYANKVINIIIKV